MNFFSDNDLYKFGLMTVSIPYTTTSPQALWELVWVPRMAAEVGLSLTHKRLEGAWGLVATATLPSPLHPEVAALGATLG